MKSRKGFTLLEVTLAGLVFSISMLALAAFMDFINIASRQAKQKDNVTTFRQKLISLMQDKRAWYRTVSSATALDNSNLLCLKDDNCTNTSGGSFKVRDSNGVVFYDPAANANKGGFDSNGVFCSSFNGVAGSPQCPYRYTLSWAPSCPTAGPCSNPGIRITGTFMDSPAASIVKNTDQMHFSIYINSEPKENPAAISDVFYVPQDNILKTLPIIRNDYFALGAQNLTIIGVTAAHSGAVVAISGSGKSVTYTGNPTFYGLDRFQYTIADGLGNSATGTVWVKVMTPYTWTGDAGDGDWGTVGNWCGTVAADYSRCLGDNAVSPTNSDLVVFDDTCTKGQCNATNSAPVFARKMELSNKGFFGYQGTFTQRGTLDIGGVNFYNHLDGYSQDSGTFVGNAVAPGTINIRGQFRLDRGQFSSSSYLNIYTHPSTIPNYDHIRISNVATFNHNGGTVQSLGDQFLPNGVANSPGTRMNTPNVIFNNLTFQHNMGGTSGATQDLAGNTIRVLGNLTINLQGLWGGRVNSGTIEAQGRVDLSNVGGSENTTTKLWTTRLVGNTNQAITGPGAFARLEINKTGGAANFNSFGITHSLTHTAGNVFVNNNSTLTFTNSAGNPANSVEITAPAISFENITFNLDGNLSNAVKAKINGNLRANKTLTINIRSQFSDAFAIDYLEGGNILTYGDINLMKNEGGTTQISLLGQLDQNISQSAGAKWPGNGLSMNKAFGDVVQMSNIDLSPHVWDNPGPGTTTYNPSLTINNGRWRMNENNLTISNSLNLSGVTARLDKGGGLLTVNGVSPPDGPYGSGVINP